MDEKQVGFIFIKIVCGFIGGFLAHVAHILFCSELSPGSIADWVNVVSTFSAIGMSAILTTMQLKSTRQLDHENFFREMDYKDLRDIQTLIYENKRTLSGIRYILEDGEFRRPPDEQIEHKVNEEIKKENPIIVDKNKLIRAVLKEFGEIHLSFQDDINDALRENNKYATDFYDHKYRLKDKVEEINESIEPFSKDKMTETIEAYIQSYDKLYDLLTKIKTSYRN